MFSLCFKSEEWVAFLKHYRDKAYLNERVFGILYILLLEGMCSKYKNYQVTVDTETFMDINKALDIARRIAKSNNYYFNFSTAHSKTNELIRFADYVASAHRKVKNKHLERYNLFKIMNYKINKDYINKAFK